MLELQIFLQLKNLAGTLESVHDRHVDIHENKRVEPIWTLCTSAFALSSLKLLLNSLFVGIKAFLSVTCYVNSPANLECAHDYHPEGFLVELVVFNYQNWRHQAQIFWSMAHFYFPTAHFKRLLRINDFLAACLVNWLSLETEYLV